MSFQHYKDLVSAGDTVILFLGFDNMMQTKVEKDKIHQTKYGALYHNDMIGKQFGTKIECTKGWLYILHPSPELWTVTLPHRTQILYSTDISMITIQLDLKPGSVVVESGTGSGSLSHAILRTVAPSGHLHTFDFHEQRTVQAKAEFAEHGFEGIVTARHRDVCNDGFDLEHVADAVFLDLPNPWEAVDSAKLALKKDGGRLCSFSPCIEQVQRTCEKLHQIGFTEISTVECLMRTLDVRTNNMPVVDLGFGHGRWCPESEEVVNMGGSKDNPSVGQFDISGKTEALEEVDDEEDLEEESIGDAAYSKQGRYDHKHHANKSKGECKSNASYQFKSGQSLLTMPGHTGYLTFATLYPL